MRHATPSLTALRAFEAAARLGSFARAADELEVSPGAISQQVSGLEAALGVRLFDRVRQRTRLTEAGQAYRGPVTAAFDRIESATIDLIGGRAQIDVTIGVLPSLGSLWLIPRLPRLAQRHPDLRLRLVTLELDFARAERSPDLEGGRVDLAVYYGDGHWPGLAGERLMDERLVAVASPKLVGPADGRRPAPFDELPLLHHSTRPESWGAWFHGSGHTARPATGGDFEHFHMLIEAARSGLGVALVPRVFVIEDLARRSLVPVSEHELAARRAYYVLHAADRPVTPAMDRVRTWLRGEAN